MVAQTAAVACIAHKSSRFVSDAGSGSRILRLRRTILPLFEEKSLKTGCFESLIGK
jgi:hypothetical protein